MTTETIERLAREADLIADPTGVGYFSLARLEDFAALVRAEALEEAAKAASRHCIKAAPSDGIQNAAPYHQLSSSVGAAIRALASK